MSSTRLEPLRYGIIGGGFLPGFMLRALAQVRGVEVAGLHSRRPPEQLARYAREHGLVPRVRIDRGAGPNVDVVVLPNFTRVEAFGIAEAVRAGARLGLICEKPLARNLREARRVLEIARAIGVPTAHFENQIHMKSVRLRSQLRPVMRAAFAGARPRSTAGRTAWFWGSAPAGGGVPPTWAVTRSRWPGTRSPCRQAPRFLERCRCSPTSRSQRGRNGTRRPAAARRRLC
jgi:predicted dehydrogenase